MLSSKRNFTIILGVLLIAAVVRPAAVKSQNVLPQIAFVSDRDGNQEIYVMSADGSNATNLTNNKADDFAPSWSPDGSKILFLSSRDQKSQLFVMQADGSAPQLLTKDSSVFAPVWSPDGKYVAYAILGGTTSMTGAGIVFSRGNAGTYVVGADGSVPKHIIDNYVVFTGPIWSPDSKQIGVLEISSQGGDFALVDVDGGNQRKLDTELVTYNPSWSPDGTQIVFGTSQMISIDVKSGQQKPLSDKKFTLNVAQKVIKALTASTASVWRFDLAGVPAAPVWSSDGKQILFTTEEGGKSDIYIINSDGSNLTNLTNNAAIDTDAVFQPQPTSK